MWAPLSLRTQQADHGRVGHVEYQPRRHPEQDDPHQQRSPGDPLGAGHVHNLVAVGELLGRGAPMAVRCNSHSRYPAASTVPTAATTM